MAPSSGSVPVLVLSGAPGSGKSTIGRSVARRLRDAELSHALVDHEWLAYGWPVPVDDRWNERIVAQNLGCVWSNFRAAGASRLIYCRVLEDRSLLRHVARAVPGAAATVVQLRAPLTLIHQRLRAREPEPDWFLGAATALVPRMDTASVADFVIENGQRPPDQVAAEVLTVVQWLS